MSKKIILLFIIHLIFIGWVHAQPTGDELIHLNEDRISLNSNGILVLGGWAVSNLIVGGIGITQTSGTTKYFHQMNAAWNGVNLAIAGFGYTGLQNQSANSSLAETVTEFHNFEKILLFNAGLDIGYMALGAYLWERGRRTESSRLIGYGQSLLLQGGFLFTFDLVLYLLNTRISSKLTEALESIQISSLAIGVSIPF
jgi:hypothetical protein